MDLEDPRAWSVSVSQVRDKHAMNVGSANHDQIGKVLLGTITELS